MKDFSQKVALISGAGSGIGRALSIELADAGCNLALLDWNKESLEETKQLLRKKNVAVSTHNFDISDKEKVQALPNEVIEFHKQIDLVFNNAGLSIVGTINEVDEKDWNWGLDILLNSVIQITTVFLPHLEKRPEAAIINDQQTGFFFNENDIDDLSLNIDLWFSKFDINLTRAERRKIIDEKYNPEYQIKVIQKALDEK